jgi:hypothetical protein
VRFKFSSLLLLAALAACGLPNNAEPTPGPTDTPTSAPTFTPTPVTPLAILVIPADLNETLSKLYQTTVYDLTQAQGIRFQVRNTLSAADRDPGLQIVIALPPDPGIAQLAAAWPDVQFLAVNIPSLAPSANVSTVGAGDQPEVEAFLAGYIAAMITEDYHTGIFTEKDTPGGTAARDAFNNGQIYYCGLCNPYAGPFYDYPIYAEIPTDATPNEIQSYANFLINYKVETVYVYPTLATPDLLNFLGTNGFSIIGTQTPIDENLLSKWVATIQPDFVHAIQTAWPDMVAGKGGVSVPSPLTLTNVNPDLLGPGKQKLAEQVLQDLLAGRIDTGVHP